MGCGGSSSQKSEVTVSTPPPTAEQTLAQKQAAAANSLGMQQAGYKWGATTVFDPNVANQYLQDNPDVASTLGVTDVNNPTEQQQYQAFYHYNNSGKNEGRQWAATGPEGWIKSGTPQEQAAADASAAKDKQIQSEIQDLVLKKLKGDVSPEDQARIETAYGSAEKVGVNNLNTQFQNALDQLNLTGSESAAARGLNPGETPISGPVSRNKMLLGQNYGTNLTNFETSIAGAKAGSMLDVGTTQQNFALALSQFQGQLAQNAQANRQAIADSFANTALGLGNLNSRNLTQTSTGSGSSGSSAGSLMGGAGGLMGGIGSLFSSSSGGTSAIEGMGSLFSSAA